MKVVYTNDLCTGCNKCVRACPILISNVATEPGRVRVNSENCIACGACLDACTHGARDYMDDTEPFFDDLAAGKKISVIVAPAFLANYPKEYKRILGYLKKKRREPYFQCFIWCGYYNLGISEVYYRESFCRRHLAALSGGCELCGKIQSTVT